VTHHFTLEIENVEFYDGTKQIWTVYFVTRNGESIKRVVWHLVLIDWSNIIRNCSYQVRVITVFPVFRLLTDFVCLYTYEFWLFPWKISWISVMLLLPLFIYISCKNWFCYEFMTTELFINKDVSKRDETLYDKCIFKCRK
jgi:hypothetical protein